MKHSLDKAIAIHEKHMNGKEPTSMKSQMAMMHMMKAHRDEMGALKNSKHQKKSSK